MPSMPISATHLQRITFPVQFSKSDQRIRHSIWWGPVWRGLFVDPEGKHYRAMGRALWLYGYLIVHANRRTGTLYRTVATVSRDMQVSKRTIQAWLALLRRHDYIRTKTTGRALVIGICAGNSATGASSLDQVGSLSVRTSHRWSRKSHRASPLWPFRKSALDILQIFRDSSPSSHGGRRLAPGKCVAVRGGTGSVSSTTGRRAVESQRDGAVRARTPAIVAVASGAA